MAAERRFIPSRQQQPHLPAGRSPGGQSRRRETTTAVGRGIGTVFGLGCLAAVYIPIALLTIFLLVGLVRNGPSLIPGAVLAVCLVFAAGIPVAAVVALRRTRVPAPDFALAARPTELARGGEVEAGLRVPDDTAPGPLEIGLVCTAFYDAWTSSSRDPGGTTRRRATAQGVAFESWLEIPATPGAHLVRFEVPVDAPFSHEGECLSFAWRITARRDLSMARDPRHDVALWVAP